MTPAQRDSLVATLLLSSRMQSLWDVRDRHVPVFAHTIDVALLCLERIPAGSDLDATAIVLGALVHDFSKLPLERLDGRSHSLLMRTEPEVAADASMNLLAECERAAEVILDDDRRAHVRHIVLSHHGAFGRVPPVTAEAHLVANCDFVAATEYRVAPVDANDLLPLLADGYRWPEAAVFLGVGRELVKTRLREACLAEGVRDWVDLLPIWRRSGSVATGSPQRQRQVARARLIHRLAREVPESLLAQLDGVTQRVGRSAPASL